MSVETPLPFGIDGTGVAYPAGYSFFMSLMFSVFLGFIAMVLAAPSLRDREPGVFTVGFLLGGLVFSWLLGAFDVDYGWLAAAGYSLGMAGFGYLAFRRGNDRG